MNKEQKMKHKSNVLHTHKLTVKNQTNTYKLSKLFNVNYELSEVIKSHSEKRV